MEVIKSANPRSARPRKTNFDISVLTRINKQLQPEGGLVSSQHDHKSNGSETYCSSKSSRTNSLHSSLTVAGNGSVSPKPVHTYRTRVNNRQTSAALSNNHRNIYSACSSPRSRTSSQCELGEDAEDGDTPSHKNKQLQPQNGCAVTAPQDNASSPLLDPSAPVKLAYSLEGKPQLCVEMPDDFKLTSAVQYGALLRKQLKEMKLLKEDQYDISACATTSASPEAGVPATTITRPKGIGRGRGRRLPQRDDVLTQNINTIGSSNGSVQAHAQKPTAGQYTDAAESEYINTIGSSNGSVQAHAQKPTAGQCSDAAESEHYQEPHVKPSPATNESPKPRVRGFGRGRFRRTIEEGKALHIVIDTAPSKTEKDAGEKIDRYSDAVETHPAAKKTNWEAGADTSKHSNAAEKNAAPSKISREVVVNVDTFCDAAEEEHNQEPCAGRGLKPLSLRVDTSPQNLEDENAAVVNPMDLISPNHEFILDWAAATKTPTPDSSFESEFGWKPN